MSTHAARAGIFELQRADSLKQQSRTAGANCVVEEDDAATDSDIENCPQEQSDLEDDALEDNEDIDDSVKVDMKKLEGSFPGISERFRLVNRIGEGRF